MYFDEDNKSIPKVNLGNRGLSSKDDFLKKIKNDEKKEKEKIQISKQKSIISKFLKKYFRSSQLFTQSKLMNNLESVKILLESKKFDSDKNEQIALKSLEKTINEINPFLNCKMNKTSSIISGYSSVSTILTYISPKRIYSLLDITNQSYMKYMKMLKNLIKIGTFQVYNSIKKDYLIDKEVTLFYLLNILLNFAPLHSKKIILNHFSLNISYIWVLSFILQNLHKILQKQNTEILLKFCEELSYILIEKRKKQIKKNSKITFFLTKYLFSLLDKKYAPSMINQLKLTLFDLFFYSDETMENIQTYKDSAFLKLFSYISSEISLKKKTNLNTEIKDIHFNSFCLMFEYIQRCNLSKVNRTEIIKGINTIIELLFSSKNKINPKLSILIIYTSSQLIVSLYKSNFEKTNYQTILEHIVNKIALKCKPELTNEILMYSIELFKDIFPALRNQEEMANKLFLISNKEAKNIQNEQLFEIISFFVLSQINYKSNYFFVEFRATKDIHQNLPFNYYYLNLLSKYLISLFTNIISHTNLEEIENLSQNMIIKCLKSLYFLDGDINFTFNRDRFWNNLELVSKMSHVSRPVLLEKMKIMPFIFPLQLRLDIGTKELKKIKEEHGSSIINQLRQERMQFGDMDMDLDNDNPILIPRENIFEASLSFYLQGYLKPYVPWKIVFVDKFGKKEDGVDAGGLYKEYIYKLSEECFGPKIGLFTESSTGFLLPNKEAYKISEKYLLMYEFIGFIVAKAICDDIKLYPNISPIFLNNIIEIENSFTDLKEYDPEVYKNLTALKQYEGDVENDFGLTFSICEEDSQTKKVRTINLIENGDKIPVTNNNRLMYIKKMTEYKLYYQYSDQCDNFRNGIQRVIDLEILKMYTGDELRQIIYGFDKDVFDIDDMKNNIQYHHWNMNDPKEVETIKNFFKIVHEFDIKEKEKLLFFCTSLKRLPIGGFKRLRPPFILSKSQQGIPTASTCVNMLKLPVLPYNQLKEKLRYVINAEAGFYYA